jgi:hypothetical protein
MRRHHFEAIVQLRAVVAAVQSGRLPRIADLERIIVDLETPEADDVVLRELATAVAAERAATWSKPVAAALEQAWRIIGHHCNAGWVCAWHPDRPAFHDCCPASRVRCAHPECSYRPADTLEPCYQTS